MSTLEWLEIENKIRRLVKDLIEPTVRRGLENKEAIDRLKKRETSVLEKVDEFDTQITKLLKKQALMDDYGRKLIEFETVQRFSD